jgi:hypothetical protein
MVTVVGTIRTGTGAPLQTPIKFNKADPTIHDGYVVSVTEATISTAADGTFSVGLEAGNWKAEWFNGIKPTRLDFAVPDSDETMDFADLITSNVLFTYTYQPIYALANPPNGSYRIKDGQHIQLYNPVTEEFHTMAGAGEAGALQVGLVEGEA